MNKTETDIPGVYVVENNVFFDMRGSFSKPYNKDEFEKIGLSFVMEEAFYSVSHKDVIRGMHYQTPPMAHDKLVFVPYGCVIDVILDLRVNCHTYGKAISLELSSENQRSVFIPVGCAHGFKSMKDGSLAMYMTNTVHVPDYDNAVRWDSFGFDWDIEAPIISEKDRSAIAFGDLKSPFRR